MLLDQVASDVANQLEDQSRLGVNIVGQDNVPESGPANSGVWWQIPAVTCIFADLKRSTSLSADGSRKDAAYAYTYFIRAMTVTLERFSARYIDIQGDGIFGLFSGRGSEFWAAACAITMRTQVEREVEPIFRRDSSSQWKLSAGIGIDRGALLVRRLGLRGAKQNEVWAGKPVNMAAKLSSCAGRNEVAVSERVFAGYKRASQLRQRALLMSCGCRGRTLGKGLDAPANQNHLLWTEQAPPKHLGLDFAIAHKRGKGWCEKHGTEYCEAILSGKRP